MAFALTDDAAAWNAGVWELDIADGAGELTRATAEPDLTLPAWTCWPAARRRSCSTASDAGRPTVEFAARQRHVTAVRRSMGAKPGSGGSAGLAWRERGAAREVFPDLWAARTVR